MIATTDELRFFADLGDAIAKVTDRYVGTDLAGRYPMKTTVTFADSNAQYVLWEDGWEFQQ